MDIGHQTEGTTPTRRVRGLAEGTTTTPTRRVGSPREELVV